MRTGERVRMEVSDTLGRPMFGAIDQTVTAT